MMKNVLYFSQVRWDWIKQRPQFLAEELAQHYNVTVVIQQPFFAKRQKADGVVNVKFKLLYRLPFGRLSAIGYINKLLAQLQLLFVYKKFSVFWFSSPLQYPFASKSLGGKVVVYDCMDDMLEFHTNDRLNSQIETNERMLYQRADYVFCSSNYLKNKIIYRYGNRDVVVVNNAIKSDISPNTLPIPDEKKLFFKKENFNISYIGTISEWIDKDLMVKIVEHFPNVCFNLFGPLCTSLPAHSNIRHCGVVDHSHVFSVMEASDALIMPFVVNELIRSVNPVKLYEYIYSGKPCLAPSYEESMPFSDFVLLYHSHEECKEMISCLLNKTYMPPSKEDCRGFSLNNTWKSRAKVIAGIIG